MGRPARVSREQLLETARRVFAAKGFDAATLADIARELDVTPAAVLRHSPSKLELFREAMSARIIAPPDVILDLRNVDPASDPRIVLRNIAERFVPFAEKIIGENIAVFMHARARSLVVPFDANAADSPPRRGFPIVAGYFRRAMDAGVIRRGDPRAMALLFMGSLQAYVIIHRVLNILPKPYPLDRYIDALLDLWSSGAIVGGHRGQAEGSPNRPRGRRRAARRGRSAALSAKIETAGRADGIGNAGVPDRQRRVSGRRPRRPHSD